MMASHAAYGESYGQLQLFIDGEWVGPGHRSTVDVIDPTTEKALGALPVADEDDVTRAIGAATRAFTSWRRVSALDRSGFLRRASDWLRIRRGDWATLISLELGKPYRQALIETQTACEILDWSAEEARRLYDRVIPARTRDMRLMTVGEPLGPVGAISGWNAPALTPARKIGYALAAGCTIVVKPSEATPGTALMIAKAFEAAGLPAGVLNVIFGDPPSIGRRLATDPNIKAISFTGGTGVGKELFALCAGTVKRMVLELGGHAPAIVFADCDVVGVAKAAVAAKYRNSGQVCTSPTRFLVEAGAYGLFVETFRSEMDKLVLGDPFDEDVAVGPLQNRRRVEATASLIDDAVAKGARVHCSTPPAGPGFWYAPSVLTDIPVDSRVLSEEPFGPLALITPFATIADAIEEANRLSFGLAAYAFTTSLTRAEHLGREIQAGSLAINHWAASFAETPFGGVRESGFGLEGGSEGVAAFRQTRFLSVASAEPVPGG